MESTDTTTEILRKVVKFLVQYELEYKVSFDDTYSHISLIDGQFIYDPRELFYDWAVDMYPSFFTWISILLNRRVQLFSIPGIVQNIIRAYEEDDIQRIKDMMEETRYDMEYINPENDLLGLQVNNDQEVIVENNIEQPHIQQQLYAFQLQGLEKKHELLRKKLEQVIDRRVHDYDSAHLVGHMIGLNEHKMNYPTDFYEQQLLSRIPELVQYQIGYDEMVSGIDPISYQLFLRIQSDPERIRRIRNAFHTG